MHTNEQREIRAQTTDLINPFGQPEPEERKMDTTTEYKDRVFYDRLLSNMGGKLPLHPLLYVHCFRRMLCVANLCLQGVNHQIGF